MRWKSKKKSDNLEGSNGSRIELKSALEQCEAKAAMLDIVPTTIMGVDREFNVTYINKVGAQAVGRSQDACIGQKCFSLFNTEHCNTQNCQVAKAMQLDGVFTSDTTARLSSGNVPIRYTATPIKDAEGNITGAIEFVLDITKEMEVTESVLNLVNSALEGKLDARADAGRFEGNYQRIVQGINDALDAIIAPLNVAAEYIDRISKGDLPEKITDEYNGDFNEIKNNLNMCIDAISELVSDAGMLTKAAVEGKLDTRADASKHQGDYAAIVKGVNNTLDAVISPLNVAAEYIDRISKGDIPERIVDDYKGDFNEIKNNLNMCMDAINALVDDAGMLANSAIEGRLNTRADAGKHQGEFANIIDGINHTIDTIVGHIDAIPTPTMIIDKDFDIRFISKAGAGVIGLSQDQLIGEKCYDHFKTSDCRTDRCACAMAMKSGHLETSETDAHPGGNNLFISYTGVPVRDQNSKIIGALEIVMDQTEVMNAMDDANAKVEFLNKIPTPVMVVDRDFNIQFMNPAGANAVGKMPEGCIGEKCYRLFNTDHCNTQDCQVAKAMQQNDVFTSDTIAKLPTGNLPIRYSGAPLKDNDGNIIGALEYALDISKEMEVTDGVMNLVNAAKEGTLDIRADVNLFEGNYRTIVQGVNDTLDNVIAPLNVAAEYIDRISKGDMPEKITDEYKGDFNEIKNNLNQLIDAMNKVVDIAQEIATGNLLVNIERRSSQDELMIALDKMVEDLTRIAADVLNASTQVASGSEQMSSGAQEMAQSASEQSASVEQVSSSMEEMNSSVIQNADNARETASISEKAAVDAEDGGKSVAETVQAMKSIAEKISVIEGIASQTNMLALNAAIEAARAGEHGKGFAVVASEVRNLAERSSTAAKEISDLSSSSVEIAEKAGKLIENIVPQIQKTAELVQEINASSSEQANGIQQVTEAIEQLNKAIQQNASSTEEMASTSEELSSQAVQLQEVAGFFKVDNTNIHTGQAEHVQLRNKSLSKTFQESSASNKKNDTVDAHSKIGIGLASREKTGVSIDMNTIEDSEFERY
ncbi:MAG: PAS domain-containing protein [Spirochaetota bacterium]|nr:PAS domain-containing protein [Spirochaetota bacterium]